MGSTTIRDARKSLRYPTLFPGFLQSGPYKFPVMVDDLSEEGGHVRLQQPLPIGNRVTLSANGLNVEAIIVRITDRGYGLRLGMTINPLAVVRANIAHTWGGSGHAQKIGDMPASAVIRVRSTG